MEKPERTDKWNDPHSYDNAAKELAKSSQNLFLNIVKEIFHKDYPKNTEIKFLSTESREVDKTGALKPQESDLTFMLIADKQEQGLHVMEFQSTNDKSILKRTIRYAMKLMMENIKQEGNVKTLEFPQSGIIFFRKPSQEITKEKIYIQIPNHGKFDITPKT